MESGPSDHYFDGYITPGLRGRLFNYKTLAVPRNITIPCKHELTEDATGDISGTVVDTLGQKQSVGLSIVVVDRLGQSLFSIPETRSEGIVAVFALNHSRIETRGFSLLLQQVACARDLFSFNVEVDSPNVSLPGKADADTWHRRMGNINGKVLELLTKTDEKGVSSKRGVSPRDVCAVRKNTQQAHPKAATLSIEQNYELISSGPSHRLRLKASST